MKRMILMTLAAASLAMPISCTNEFIEPDSTLLSGPVTVSASIPATKSVPTAPAGYDLRCVLVVDYPAAEDQRFEQVAAGNDNFIFTFTPQQSGYTCLFWADYIEEVQDAGAASFADKYYDTRDLHSVGYVSSVLTDGSIFNNDACDAFYGSMPEGQSSVTLYRPFAKLTFKNPDGAISSSRISVTSYNIYTAFDVLTGTSASEAGTTVASMPETAPANASEGLWFYSYVFAPVTGNRLPGTEIAMTVDGAEKTIPVAEIPLEANHDQGINIAVGTSTDVTVDIEGDYGVSAPKVGDFFYTDGTWSTELVESKTVAGVVFALANGAASADNLSYYAGTGLEKINGWVVAAADAGSGVKFHATFTQGGLAAFPDGVSTATTDDYASEIKGYANTSAWYTADASNYSAAAAAKDYDVDVDGTSGWYLPSSGQLAALAEVYAEKTGGDGTMGDALAVKEAFQTLASAGKGTEMSSGYYWTSTGGVTGGNNGVFRCGFHSDNHYKSTAPNANLTSGSFVRAVLTF